MNHQSTTRAFQEVLREHVFSRPITFSEDFAQKRFQKKFQEPELSRTADLADKCWQDWCVRDCSLPFIGRLLPTWYKARAKLHSELGSVSLDDLSFPVGSEFIPTRGKNSLEARLSSSKWTCTIDSFEQFASICYNHTGLKRAVRSRFASWYRKKNFDVPQRYAERYMYRRFMDHGVTNGIGFHIFSWKLRQLTELTHGSRFSTVPKNNEKRRPINIEPFGNILIQRAIGNWIRAEIRSLFGIDLDHTQHKHRLLIRETERWATIDLKDASDSISLDLCRFLLPNRVYKFIDLHRSGMILGPDGSYRPVKKVSSMGNGFTFELMTLILLSVARELDCEASVFGDDIVIHPAKANELITLLNSVGFVVNEDKSFVDGPFRESCGANYHSDEGYIESYDFLWPTSIGDCCMIWNKVVRLAPLYPSFSRLKQCLGRALPRALHGGDCTQFRQAEMLGLIGNKRTEEPETVFPSFFVTKTCAVSEPLSREQRISLERYCLNPTDFYLVRGFEFRSKLRTDTLSHLNPRRHWAKYLMYLASGRRAKDVYTGEGAWTDIWFVKSGERFFRASSISN